MENNGKYVGLTVNERLYEAGIIKEWDRAVSIRNRDRMIELLGEVDLSEQAEQIADTLLSDPKSYGL